MDFSIKQILRNLLANSFQDFVKHFWEVVSHDKFQTTYHTETIIKHLQLQAEGEIKHLFLNAPPRFGKSIILNVLYPVWRTVRKPSIRIVSATYSQDLSIRDSQRARDLILSPEFQSLFSDLFQISDDNNRKEYYANDRKGTRLATSIQSRTQGMDAELILADDLATLDSSEIERERAKKYYDEILTSRLVWGSTTSNIILSGHRCGEDDLYQSVYEQHKDDDDWTFLILPIEADPEYSNSFRNKFWKDERPKGELLWKEATTAKRVQELKRKYRHRYDLIFNQKIVAQVGKLFNSAWFQQTFTDEGNTFRLSNGRRVDKATLTHFGTADLAITTKAYSDYTVLLEVWAGQGVVLFSDMLRERIDGAKIVSRIGGVARSKDLQFLAVEDQAFQKIVIGQLRQQGLAIKGIRPESDKVSRSVCAQILAEAGQIYLPAKCDWVGDFINELVQFPNGKHDDICDALSYSCQLAQKYAGVAPEEPMTEQEMADKAKEEREKKFQEMLNLGTGLTFRRR